MQAAHSTATTRTTSRNRARRGGFSLVEIIISLGVVSVSMISILGLLPVGLSNFQKARANTVEAQIVQALANDILLTDFGGVAGLTGREYEYDDAGEPVVAATSRPIYRATLEVVSLDDERILPIKLQSGPVGNATDEALSVRIVLTNVAHPGQRHTYSLLVTKNSL